MSNNLNPGTDPSKLPVFQFRIRGHLGSQWSDWFNGLNVTLEDNGDTLLTGPVTDQAALHGLLKKVRDLGMSLLSVVCINHEHEESTGVNQFRQIHQNQPKKGGKK